MFEHHTSGSNNCHVWGIAENPHIALHALISEMISLHRLSTILTSLSIDRMNPQPKADGSYLAAKLGYELTRSIAYLGPACLSDCGLRQNPGHSRMVVGTQLNKRIRRFVSQFVVI
ncbi:hypothetical protein N5J06_03920 [Ralstonia sp. CHL-2022]|uniref:Uncharacterized protein n=1 Tax=Ralstonia mojiangensis TaxID=2953895 RepID=A0ABT2L3T7_9RALS|nr:hypothetical protein [Ralstonia mojiangensis]MCT7310077.1 hypothetical protein [Ralstonia mojiangensis]